MADDVARDRTKVTFVRVHGAELSDAAGHEAEKLNDAQRPAGLDPAVKEAIQIAEAESDAIDKLRVAPGDRAQARDQRAELRHQAVRANQLVGRLGLR
jgi:orotidine-5'-phosphate decarboxylase